MSTTPTLTIEDFWRFDTGQQQIPLDGHDGAEVTHNPGSGYSIEVWLTGRSDPPAATPEAWPDADERWRILRSYQARQGEFALGQPMGGSVWYAESHDGEIPAGSLLVALRPPADSASGIGGWFLIEEVQDLRTLEHLPRLSVELTALAPLAEYPDHQAVRRSLERAGIGIY